MRIDCAGTTRRDRKRLGLDIAGAVSTGDDQSPCRRFVAVGKEHSASRIKRDCSAADQSKIGAANRRLRGCDDRCGSRSERQCNANRIQRLHLGLSEAELWLTQPVLGLLPHRHRRLHA